MQDPTPDLIDEIANVYQDGQQIMLVEGTLTKLYPAKNTQHGQIQNGEITDADGFFMKITFADVIQPMTARGQWISVASTSGQHGYTGVKVKDDGQYGRFIWVTPSATITYPNGAPQAPANQGQRPPPRQAPPQQQRPTAGNNANSGRRPQAAPRTPPQAPSGQQPQGQQPPRNTPQARGENQFEAVARFVDCFFHVHSLVNEKMKTIPVVSELGPIEFHDLVSRATATVFVDVAKSGVAATWNPNFKPRRFPPPPANPNDWPECYIEKEGSALDGQKLSEISDDNLRKLHEYYDKKKSNTKMAECVYQAAIDRKIFQSEDPQQPSENDGGSDAEQHEEDDIPF